MTVEEAFETLNREVGWRPEFDAIQAELTRLATQLELIRSYTTGLAEAPKRR